MGAFVCARNEMKSFCFNLVPPRNVNRLTGAWHCAQVETVSCRRWKQDLQLNGKGKEGSRLLAIRLFPTATDLLK